MQPPKGFANLIMNVWPEVWLSPRSNFVGVEGRLPDQSGLTDRLHKSFQPLRIDWPIGCLRIATTPGCRSDRCGEMRDRWRNIVPT